MSPSPLPQNRTFLSSHRRLARSCLPWLGWLATLLPGSLGAAVPPTPGKDEPVATAFQTSMLPILQTYCYDCHGGGKNKGGVQLDDLQKAGKLADHDFWLRVLKNVRAATMPPADEDQPSADERARMFGWIKQHAFGLDATQPDPGRVILRRLNRSEYRNTVHDLLGVDFDTKEELPADDTGYGFDNIGSVLTVSPTLLEKLLDGAQKVVNAAVPVEPRVVAEQAMPGREFLRPGQEFKPPTAEDFGIPAEFLEFLGKSVLEAQYLSFYEPGAVQRTFHTEADGTFEMTLELQTAEKYRNVQDQLPPDKSRCTVRFKIDGAVVAEKEFERIGSQRVIPLPVKAHLAKGDHTLELSVEPIPDGSSQTRQLRLRFNALAVKGPLEPEKWVRPKRFKEFFGEEGIPASARARKKYLTRFLQDFTTRAYRRPVDADTVNRLVAIAETVGSQAGHNHQQGLAQAMVAVLASPRFIFRAEEDEPLKRGQKYPLVDEYSLASRLSYFLWSSMPDDELMQLAGKHQLRANQSAQYARMLKDPKFSRFVSDFTGQWLQARDTSHIVIDALSIDLRDKPRPEVDAARVVFRSLIERDPITFTPEEKASFDKADELLKQVDREPKPKLNQRLRKAMQQETELYFASLLQEDRSALELIESNYTFLNEDLAKHYGIPEVKGPQMRRVTLPADSPRGGVLTQATVLVVTSNPTRTSPVKRGVFILDNILGLPPAPPPPNIPPLEAVADPEAIKKMSMKEQIKVHTTNPLCASCHKRMDPLGLALDNFNALGVWRDTEYNKPIESDGALISGEPFKGVRDLKHILATSRHRDFYQCLSQKLLTYATGRGMEYTDTTTLDVLVDRLEQNNGRMSVLLQGIIDSAAFQQRRPVVDTPVAGSAIPSRKAERTAFSERSSASSNPNR